ncbi:MAG: ABC transporter permease [Candidatus Pacebacteria bacterium]|nr:ABC transporter permease [Candidatus Paceibacterota bacterium]
MQKFFSLVKKEIKELVTIQMVVPLIIMVLAFSWLGSILATETEKSQAPLDLWVINNDSGELSENIIVDLEANNFKVETKFEDLETVKSLALANDISMLLVIDAGFSQALNNYQAQNIELYSLISNFSLTTMTAGSKLQAVGNIINTNIKNYWVNSLNLEISASDLEKPVNLEEYVVIGEKEAKVPLMAVSGFISQQTTFVPVILFIIIVIAAQMVATAIASEKENKTFETLLTLPVGRKTIVFAKLLAAGIISILFALFYLIGLSRYMGGLTGGAGAVMDNFAGAFQSLGISFSFIDYTFLGLSLFLGIMTALSLALLLGLMVDNVKAVQAATTPLMVLVLIPYLLTMFIDIDKASLFIKYLVYVIPFSYPFLAVQKLVIADYSFITFGLIYQLFFFLLVVILTTKVFSSDKVLSWRFNFKGLKK